MVVEGDGGDPGTLSARFFARRHTILLGGIVAALAVRPLIGDAGIAPIAFSIALLVLLLIALLTIQVDELVGERERLLVQRRRRTFIGWLLAVAAIVERMLVMFYPSPRLLLVGSIGWGLFFAFVAWSQLRSMLKQREVTGETISNAVAVYLLLGLTWGVVYVVLFELDPAAFNFGATPIPDRLDMFPVLAYFSMTTLATIGFGDITPVSLQARYAAVAEGIAGQFYLAILVARLVGMHMSHAAGQVTRDQTGTPKTGRPTG